MIHKRNAALTALAMTIVIAIVFSIYPRIYHGAIGYWYWPSLFVAVVIAHFTTHEHFPPNSIGWLSFAVYSIFYLLIFLLIYVVILEIYILRGVLHHLDDAKKELGTQQPDSKKALEKIGMAVSELESRRRKHFLLQPMDDVNLSEPPDLLGARAITRDSPSRPVQKLFRKLRSKIAADESPVQASVKISNLKKDAAAMISGKQ